MPRTSPAFAPRPDNATAWRPTSRMRPRQHAGRSYVYLRPAGVLAALLIALAGFPLATAAVEGPRTYQVMPGDTLWKIAGNLGLSVGALVQANGLANPDRLIAGQVLRLDPANQPIPSPTPATHTVQPGETLGHIAVRNGVSIRALADINDLADPDRLRVGQQLRLPTPAATHASDIQSAASVATPAPSLEQRLQAEIHRLTGTGGSVRVGVAALNLDTGERLSIRADESFPAASIMKLALLVELHRQGATTELPWTDELRTLATNMMRVSDNDAANALMLRVGTAHVNATMNRLGLHSSQLVNPFQPETAANRHVEAENRSTPADMLALLHLIATDQVVNARVSNSLRLYLAENEDRSKLARLLPTTTHVAHKSGWYEGVVNDVGLVKAQNGTTWAVAVFTEGTATIEDGNQLVAAISKTLHDAWGE